ncbi:hypothetical protein H6764_03075 [Candidatus Nomurabacteria bacterium]|nr:hypothetical protein [Candidatus Nomurabacteria bacterium]
MTKPRFFEFPKSKFSKKERELIAILCEVGEVIHKIWDKQYDSKAGRANFYPSGVSKKQIVEAAKKDKDILAPYTLVKKDKGKLVAVSYRDEYKKEIDQICVLLDKAADVADSRGMRKFFLQTRKAFDKGDFNTALRVYLGNIDLQFDILVGPTETYNDKLFGKKKAFEYILSVYNPEESKYVEQMERVMQNISILKPKRSVAEKIDAKKVRVRVDDAIMYAGPNASLHPSSTNLPNEPEMVAKYGTKISVYRNAMHDKFEKKIKPHVSRFVDIGLTDSELEEGYFRLIMLHEITEGVVKFSDMQKRLEQYFDAVREFNAFILGVKSASYHVLQGLIDTKQYHSILFGLMLYGIDVGARYQNDSSLIEYARGFSVLLSFALERGSIEIVDKKIKVDPVMLSSDIDVMSSVMLQLSEEGSVSDAETLFNEYADFSVFEKLEKV